jgi:hypothetical protein
MASAYSYTEKIVSTDNVGAVTTTTDVHTITHDDASILALRGGEIDDAVAVQAATKAGRVAENATAAQAQADALKAIAPVQATAQANAMALAQMAMWPVLRDQDLIAKAAPIYIPPASFAVMPDGQVLSRGVNGEVYRDGRQLPGVACAKIVQIGKSIFALGRTVPSWWQWNGANWGAAPVTDFDPNVLK